MRHCHGIRPEEPFFVEDLHRLADRTQLSPGQTEDEGDHQAQSYSAFAQTNRVIQDWLALDRWTNQLV